MIRAILAAAAIATVSAGTWKEVTTLDVVALDLDFYNATHGYISGFINGENGIQLLKTTNSGMNWTSSLVATPLLPLSFSMATNRPNILVTGLFTSYISHDDGQTFNPIKGDEVFQPLSSYYEARTSSFFLVGTTVAQSTDSSGDSFKAVKVANLKPNSTPRFGAFPSSDVWYLSCGSQPQQADDDTKVDDDAPPSAAAYARRLSHWTGGNYAQILMTKDAGQTWTSMYYNNTHYSMGIACADENNCCFITEADQLEPVLGVSIMCTHDAGSTWTAAYSDHVAGTSLMDIQYLGNNGYVASGTASSGSKIGASFIFSKDNGKTWTVDTPTGLPEIAITASNFVDSTHAYALGLDRFNSEAFIAYES